MEPVRTVNCIVLYGLKCFKEVSFGKRCYLFRCDKCNFTTKTKTKFNRHYLNDHRLRNKRTLYKCKRCEAPPVESRITIKFHFSLHVEKWNAHMRRSVRNTGKLVGPVKLSKVIRDRELEKELEALVSEDDWNKRGWLIEHIREARLRAIDVSKTSTSNSPTSHEVQSRNLRLRSRECVVMEPTTSDQQQHRHTAVVHLLMAGIILSANCSIENKERARAQWCANSFSIHITPDIEVRREFPVRVGTELTWYDLLFRVFTYIERCNITHTGLILILHVLVCITYEYS